MTAESTPAPAPRGLVLVIALLSMVGPFSIDTYMPSFPDIEAAFGVSRAALAQTLGVYLAAFAVSTLMWGPLSDAIGRRRAVLSALVGYLITSIGCMLAPSFAALIGFRFAQGLFASGGIIIGRAVIRDAYHGHQAQRAMAQVMMVFSIAPALAPIVGGWMHELGGWRAVFAFLAAYGLGVIALAWWRLPETLPVEHRHSLHPLAVGRAYGQVLTHRRFLALVFAFATWFGGMFVYIAGSPSIIFDHLHLGVNSFAVLFVPMVSGVLLGSYFASHMAHRWEPARMVNIALVLMVISVVLNLAQAQWLAPSPWTVIGTLPLYTFGVAMALPNLTVLALDCFPRNRGMASAVQGFLQMTSNSLVAALLVPAVAPMILWFAGAQAALLAIAVTMWFGAQAFGRQGAAT